MKKEQCKWKTIPIKPDDPEEQKLQVVDQKYDGLQIELK